MSKPVCVITGVGEGTGAALARRFTQGGYRVAMLARNSERLRRLKQELQGSRGFVCDIANLEHLVEVCRRVRDEIGLPEVIVHNAVSATFKDFLEADPEDLERNFRVNTTTLLYMAREFAPEMIERGHGAT